LHQWITKKLAGEISDANKQEFTLVDKEIGELAGLSEETLQASLGEISSSLEL